jgi:hypothetical protein
MTTTPSIITEAEDFVRRQSDAFLRPRTDECLCGYVLRMLDEFACNGSRRHSMRYRDIMAPRATGLAQRLRNMGACCCDCEMFLNAFVPNTRAMHAALERAYTRPRSTTTPVILPPCLGVRRGSTQPCRNWLPRSR